jgi:hypothetical protein
MDDHGMGNVSERHLIGAVKNMVLHGARYRIKKGYGCVRSQELTFVHDEHTPPEFLVLAVRFTGRVFTGYAEDTCA